ncbi:MAG: Flp pilus assembly protein CpaB [Caldilineaceae bacterium]
MGRTRGLIWLVAGLFIALVAGLLAFQVLNRAETTAEQEAVSGPLTSVVVAARDVPVRTQLVAEDLRVVDVAGSSLPPGAITSLDAAIGMLTTSELFEGETVISDRLLDPTVVSPDGRMALMMVEDEVLMAIPAMDVLSRVQVLKPGDRVDVLTSITFKVKNEGATDDEEEEVQATFFVLQNIAVAGLTGAIYAPRQTAEGGSMLGGAEEVVAANVPDAVLLTLTPQDALALKYAIDAGGIMDFVLRAPGVDRPWETDAVDADYMKNRYDLPLEPGR